MLTLNNGTNQKKTNSYHSSYEKHQTGQIKHSTRLLLYIMRARASLSMRRSASDTSISKRRRGRKAKRAARRGLTVLNPGSPIIAHSFLGLVPVIRRKVSANLILIVRSMRNNTRTLILDIPGGLVLGVTPAWVAARLMTLQECSCSVLFCYRLCYHCLLLSFLIIRSN